MAESAGAQSEKYVIINGLIAWKHAGIRIKQKYNCTIRLIRWTYTQILKNEMNI